MTAVRGRSSRTEPLGWTAPGAGTRRLFGLKMPGDRKALDRQWLLRKDREMLGRYFNSGNGCFHSQI